MLRAVADYLNDQIDPFWILRDKDVLLELANRFGLRYTVLSAAPGSLLAAALVFAADTFRVWRLSGREHLGAWVTKYGAGNIGARLRGCPSLSFNDDDADVVPLVAWTSYPFAHVVAATRWTRMGRFESKAIRYTGFHELFYLHPNRFLPDPGVRGELRLRPDERFVLVRLSALSAHHDIGVRGVGDHLIREIRRCCEGRATLIISSERPLPGDLEGYRFAIPADRIHHALAAAHFFVGDSQTMTAEAALLGTPALRFNDFVGRISYIAELERRRLAFGYKHDETATLLAKVDSLLASDDEKAECLQRREALLAEVPDPVPWFADRLLELPGLRAQ
jgi:uncharacterized protein